MKAHRILGIIVILGALYWLSVSFSLELVMFWRHGSIAGWLSQVVNTAAGVAGVLFGWKVFTYTS